MLPFDGITLDNDLKYKGLVFASQSYDGDFVRDNKFGIDFTTDIKYTKFEIPGYSTAIISPFKVEHDFINYTKMSSLTDANMDDYIYVLTGFFDTDSIGYIIPEDYFTNSIITIGF